MNTQYVVGQRRLAMRTLTNSSDSTGDVPHVCPYPNCGMRFGDPARRHRHMKSAHKHIPAQRRTQSDYDLDSLHLGGDVSEPEEEDP